MLVCDQAELSAAMRAGSFGSSPDAVIMLAGRVSGGGQGVAQAVGAAMSSGQTATIRLPASGDPVVFVHWIDSTGVLQTAERAYPNPSGRTATVLVPAIGVPVFR